MAGFKTISPIDGQVYLEREYSDAGATKLALSASKSAQNEWCKVSLQVRKTYCLKALEYFKAHQTEIAKEISWQMGRPIRYAEGEVSGLSERWEYMCSIAEQALETIALPDKPGFKRYIKREPLGVVAVLAPWNYPYLTAVNAIIPALLAGNSVILKHSAQTPLCAERFDEAFKYAQLPDGVFQYLHLSHDQTESFLQSEELNHVAFTGSVNAGAMVEKAIAGQFKSVGLELGGKDPAYVRSDADLDYAVETVIDGAFFNSGQSCCGIERAYVHADIYDEFVAKATSLVESYKLGRSDDPETTLGPLVKDSAAEFARSQVTEAVSLGATALIDPELFPLNADGSCYMAPQLLKDVDHRMRVMTEETFGPVLGIQKVGSDEEAISLMNDSEYGLTAAIFSEDHEVSVTLADQIETGTVFLNRCDYLDPGLAWTGVKNSGKGCTLSQVGFESLTRPKSYHLKSL